jgi:septal ring factor EnvC (AmiA/AmiB activator)
MGAQRHPQLRFSRFAPLAIAGVYFALVAALGPTASSDARSVEGLNERISAAQDEARKLAARVDARGSDLAAASARAQSAAQREAELGAVLGRSQQREVELAAAVTSAEEDLEAARGRLARATRALANRLVAIYKSGVPDATTLLLRADGFEDLATRADLLDRIRTADSSLVARVRALRVDVAAKVAKLSEAREGAQAFSRRVASARDRIASVRAQAESEAAALLAARQRQRAALERLREQVGSWTAEVEELQQVSVRQAQQAVASWVGDWAIPRSIVMCESGGSFQALNPSSGAGGAYQILPSTWRAYGGRGLPHQASPAEQHRIAALIWRDSGSAAWVC